MEDAIHPNLLTFPNICIKFMNNVIFIWKTRASPIIRFISFRIFHTEYYVWEDVRMFFGICSFCTTFHSLPYTRKTIKYEKLFIVYFPFTKNEINFIESIKIFLGICQGRNEIFLRIHLGLGEI